MTPNADPKLVRRVFALLREAQISDRGERLDVMSWITQMPVGSTNELGEAELDTIASTLAYWLREGRMQEYRQRIAKESGG